MKVVCFKNAVMNYCFLNIQNSLNLLFTVNIEYNSEITCVYKATLLFNKLSS
jgi:hypothetical protein